VEVLVTPRAGIPAHATLNALALVLATIHELERSRAEREERLTLWPIEEIPGDDDRAVVDRHHLADGIIDLGRIGKGRFELTLGAYPDLVKERYHAWLLQQENTGRVFTTEQLVWLEHIRDHVDPPERSTEGSPDRVLGQKVLADRIRRALDELPFDQRTALVLREIDGLSYDEIGFSLGIAVGTVKSRLARAREALRAELRDA